MSHSPDQEILESPHQQKTNFKNKVGGTPDKKKKKGIFGGLFGGKKNKKNKDSAGTLPANDSLRSGSRASGRKLKKSGTDEYSI